MEKTQQKRQQLTEKMADYLLQHGLGGFTLRSLAAAAGTSDRMLLHYFSDKDDLLAATLTLVSERLLESLRNLQRGKMDQRQLIVFLAGLINDPAILPYTNLWLELASVATRSGEPYGTVADQISVAFLDWIKASLDADNAQSGAEEAAYLLAFVEGIVLLNAVGKQDEVDRAIGWMVRQT